ncbi:uncharacterized protein LOC123549413 [Mercenaria mercenaria]|uniref:uncharacterized protein LOC123549413 n=1 Tax=Mercenaria mercenaria TaxID=6596 RepID=UPI00234EEAEE|nr:uncharacterized protein LOC123549413 [Mercenaria mercenaria]
MATNGNCLSLNQVNARCINNEYPRAWGLGCRRCEHLDSSVMPWSVLEALESWQVPRQLELNSRVVSHIERLATLFGVTQLHMQCQEYIQKNAPPDSQNLNLRPENQIEPDSSINGAQPAGREERLISTPDDNSQGSNLSRSNSVCSGISSDLGNSSFGMVVKTEPLHLASYEAAQSRHSSPGAKSGTSFNNMSLPENLQTGNQSGQNETSMSMLEKLMSPIVNLKKLPKNITPATVVMVSDDENDDVSNENKSSQRKPAQYSLEEKEAIAIEAKRYGTTHVANTRNIPLPDILSWMMLFGLRNPSNQRLGKHGKQVNHDADLALVRWIVQQQEMNGCVDLNSMKQYALTVHQQTNPKFCASKTWLGNFLQRNMSVLQGTKFVQGDKGDELDIYGSSEMSDVVVKQEVLDSENKDVHSGENVLETLGQHTVLEDIPLNEQQLVNEVVEAGLSAVDDDDDDDNYEDDNFVDDNNVNDLGNSHHASPTTETSGPNLEMIQTPFGKRPIIIGQSKAFDAKSERKIVQWVLERQARDGYVFTDDFKNYARSLYKGSKVFGATQAWMKKFLRRNRALKNVKFCSKFKNVYSTEDKVNCVAMAKRYGVSYAAKHTGINQKVIHCWKLAHDKGMLNVDQSALMKIDALCSSFPSHTLSQSSETPTTSGINSSANFSPSVVDQATRGIVPEFEKKIVQEIKDLQLREGSVNYNDISKISQSIYKETRPNFKASYNWVKSFLDRHKQALVDIELENVSKLLIENDSPAVLNEHKDSQLNNPKITEMVDQALLAIGNGENLGDGSGEQSVKEKRPVIVGPSVMFDRKTERKLVDWALEKQETDGYVFTDDFKLFAKSVHTGPKNFSASSGWMTLFLRRHRVLKKVQWRSKYKNNYTEEEKIAAVAQAKRLGTGHVGRILGIEPKLISAWRFKMEKNAPKQTFWKGTKIKKFGMKSVQARYVPVKHTALSLGGSDAARGIVPEFEQRIVDLILEEHQKEGSISYEEMSRIAQSVYKETRPTFKASYAWIRNFMKRNEQSLQDLNIDNVKKVFLPEDEGIENSSADGNSAHEVDDFRLQKIFHKRPIIVGQSRSLDTKTEKKLVHWTVEQQEKNGYVFLDQFKSYAQSLYKGQKKFAATQAWRIKFLRRNHNALKNVKFQSSFRNQYSLEEKKVIVQEAKKYGAAHVAKTTGIEHCLINAWRQKLERMGIIPAEGPSPVQSPSTSSERPNFVSKLKQIKDHVGPGLYSYRGIVPAFEKKIVTMIMNKMDEEGSVSYQDVSNFSRAVYKETRPHFKASYNWIKDFIKRHKKELRHAEFEQSKRISHDIEPDTEIIIPEDHIGNVEKYLNDEEAGGSSTTDKKSAAVKEDSLASWESQSEMDIVIDNPEDPNYESQFQGDSAGISKTTSDKVDIGKIVAKRPIIIGKAVHFNRKTEKKIVEWLMETQNREGFVFTDDFRRYARSLYTGPPEKFGATNAWIAKFLRRNRLEGKIEFQSKLKGNNAKFEEKICELIQEQQQKEESVSHEDIQKITQSVYKETRPNFRACYGWIKDFLKRNKDKLVGVDFENVKKVYIPDEDERDGVLIQNYDPSKSLPYLDTSSSSITGHTDERSNLSFSDGQSHDSSWFDLESSVDHDSSRSHIDQSPKSVLEKLASQKRPVIIGPPRGMDSKTEKKLVHWMQEQQEKDGCVYLDLFKEYAKSVHSGPKKFAATQAWMTKFKQRNHEALKNVVIKSRFRNEYSMEEKLQIVEQAKRLGCNHVGRQLGINGGVIYSWKVQLEQMDKLGGGAAFNESFDSAESSSRGVVPEFENSIVRMVLETQRAKGSVTYEDVSVCARSVYKETRPNFKASNNWVMDFIRKYKADFKDVNFENQRKIHTEEEKLHILSEEKKYGTDHVVKKRNISASTIYQWKRNMQAKAIPIPKYKAIVSSKIKKKYARGKNIKTYTLEEKRNMVAVAEANGVTYAALKLGISRTMLGKWIRYFRDQGENIVINYTHSSTMKKELVQKVVAWVLEENDKLGIVLTNRIIEHARKVFEEAYTGYNATQNWLEGFLAQNSEKFEKVRFRDVGDRDMDFSDEIKLKLSRYAEKHGAVETAELAGLQPKIIYHWRRNMKMKGHDLTVDTPAKVEVKQEDATSSSSAEPKSLMQQKLDRIAAKYSTDERKAIVSEASVSGVSATASKHKLPLPLMLKWMKLYLDGTDIISQSASRSASVSSEERSQDRSQEKLKVRLPSIEKAAKSSDLYKKHSKEYKKQVVEEAKKIGVKQMCEKTGLSNSTVYYWMKEERENSVDSSRDSMEKSGSSARSSLDRESSNPVPIKDIKREPGLPDTLNASGSDSPSKNRYVQQPLKLPRKYTEEQKLEAAQRALEIGHKPAAIELDIPLTNVKRWFEMYKDRLIGQTLKSKSPAASQKSTPVMSKEANVESPTRISVEDRKRKISETVTSPGSTTKRFKYTDEDRIAFVKETEVIGTSAVAAKAGVSMDLVYRWRSKFLKAIRAEREAAEEANDTTANNESESLPSSPKMPAPRNSVFDIAAREGMTVVNQGKSKTDEAQFAYLGLPVNKNVGENSPEDEVSNALSEVTSDDKNKSDVDFVNFESVRSGHDLSDSAYDGHATDLIEISDDTDDSPNVHSFDDIDIIAADQILEMTSSYMEAEKEHERDPFGFEKDTRIEKGEHGLGKNSLSILEDTDTVGNVESESETTSVGVKVKDSVTSEEKEGDSEEGSMGMIKIVNIKSEASTQ